MYLTNTITLSLSVISTLLTSTTATPLTSNSLSPRAQAQKPKPFNLYCPGQSGDGGASRLDLQRKCTISTGSNLQIGRFTCKDGKLDPSPDQSCDICTCTQWEVPQSDEQISALEHRPIRRPGVHGTGQA